MNAEELEKRIVRYGDLKPCKTAFIDAHTPGSDKKENFTIIGGGVSESADQHVHIEETPGFNIGAAGQPPRCRNSLHSHRTAEVFFVHKGKWRFFWGYDGTAGEVVLQEGDIFDIPTGIFRGFENIGTDYGIIMAVLGGDDAGGGVVWAPQVIEDAREHGLVLAKSGKLYDTKKGEKLPQGQEAMEPMSREELEKYPMGNTADIVPFFVGRYWDMTALARGKPAKIIGEKGLIRDRPGFEIEFLVPDSSARNRTQSRHHVLMVHRGHWRVKLEKCETVLAPGDVCALPPDTDYELGASMEGEGAMFRIINTDDPAGPTQSV